MSSGNDPRGPSGKQGPLGHSSSRSYGGFIKEPAAPCLNPLIQTLPCNFCSRNVSPYFSASMGSQIKFPCSSHFPEGFTHCALELRRRVAEYLVPLWYQKHSPREESLSCLDMGGLTIIIIFNCYKLQCPGLLSIVSSDLT